MTRERDDLRPATLCVHGGHRPTPEAPAVVGPTYRSATYLQSEESYAKIRAGRSDEVWIYSRYANPGVQTLERRIAALEGTESSLAFSSGTAALLAAILAHAPPGGVLLASEALYGGTLDLLKEGASRFELELRWFDGTRGAAALAGRMQGVSVVLVETLSNPTLIVADVPGLAQAAHGAGAKLLVDATFTPPVIQRPARLGADLVMHSATKYLGGHSDLIAGVVSGSRADLAPIWTWRKRLGGVLDPEPAFLLERGLKTLAVRVREHARVAGILASFLASHPAVARVHYPGLASHPSHELASRCMELPGGMLAFELAGGDDAAPAFLSGLRVALDAPSLGGVETLVSLPALMSHPNLSVEERRAVGILPGLVRVSVGIEDPADLVEDFGTALDGVGR